MFQFLGLTLKHRRVKHYGYEFQYDTNNVNKDFPLSENIPSECSFLLDRLKERNISVVSSFPTQLTVNHYQPGQGKETCPLLITGIHDHVTI
jgi:alkylated DNA repair protein alkB family protein 8